MRSATLLVVALLYCISALLAFPVGEKVCMSAGLNFRDGPCGNVIGTTQGGEQGTVLGETPQTCSFGRYTWVHVKLSSGKDVWAAAETGLIYACSGGATKNLDIVQVHQKWDTPDSFDGSWACGPTSTVMALTYFKKLAPHPITISSPYKHTNDYGWYVSSIYTSPTGFVFNRMQPDPRRNPAYGAYGTCTEEGAAWAWRIQQYVENHGLHSQFFDAASFDTIKHAIDNNWPVVLSTQLSSAGHLILIRGYMANNQTLIANDPWGNAAQPNYGQLLNGGNVHYSWSFVKAKWMVIVKP